MPNGRVVQDDWGSRCRSQDSGRWVRHRICPLSEPTGKEPRTAMCGVPKFAIPRMRTAIIEGEGKGIERGFEVCSKTVGPECFGDICTLKIKDCGDMPVELNFHTHPNRPNTLPYLPSVRGDPARPRGDIGASFLFGQPECIGWVQKDRLKILCHPTPTSEQVQGALQIKRRWYQDFFSATGLEEEDKVNADFVRRTRSLLNACVADLGESPVRAPDREVEKLFGD